jgi:anti-sigma regulatory factor (Ser/Thr protein kinase)
VLLRQEVSDGVEVLSVVGAVGPGDAAALQRAISRAVELSPRGVVLDLSDSGALSAEAVDVVNWMSALARGWPRPALGVCCSPQDLTDVLLPSVQLHARREDAIEHIDDRPEGRHLRTEVVHSPHAAAQARRFLAEAARAQQLGPLADDLAVVVSELVTNAVRHGAPPVILEIDTTDESVTVVVADGAPGRPGPQQALEDAEGGRGLTLVEALSGDTGVRPQPPGKAVWAELPRSAPPR